MGAELTYRFEYAGVVPDGIPEDSVYDAGGVSFTKEDESFVLAFPNGEVILDTALRRGLGALVERHSKAVLEGLEMISCTMGGSPSKFANWESSTYMVVVSDLKK